MTTRWTFGAALLAACVAATAAQAKTKIVAKSGTWEAFGGTTTNGQPVCGISTTQGKVYYFGLKHFAGNQTYVVQIGNAAWRVANRKKYNLTVRFDGRARWDGAGTTMHFGDGDAGVEFRINRNQLGTFTRELFSSRIIAIHIDSGRDGGLTDLLFQAGVAADVRAAFETCNRGLR